MFDTMKPLVARTCSRGKCIRYKNLKSRSDSDREQGTCVPAPMRFLCAFTANFCKIPSAISIPHSAARAHAHCAKLSARRGGNQRRKDRSIGHYSIRGTILASELEHARPFLNDRVRRVAFARLFDIKNRAIRPTAERGNEKENQRARATSPRRARSRS